MNTNRLKRFTSSLALFAAALFVSSSSLRAQDAPPPPDNGAYPSPDNNGYDAPDTGQDPPSRVARISYIDGAVSFQPGGQGDWGAAARNRPVTIGDKIWSDNNSRAELQAGQASIHLSSMTALSFLNLDEQTTQMRLAEGSINFRVRELREGDVYEVDTPNVAFTVTQAGAFRIDVNENGDGTRITAIRGEGQVATNGQTYTIHNGERGEFNGTDNVTYFVSSAPGPDDFDRWCNSRDLKDDDSVSARYVSRDIPGYSDLDDNGTWNEEPDYGPVWYPSAVDVGWSPYSYGYWNYVGPWGWTWIGYEPWGFAPYHYGRWAYIGSRWGWCPGPYYARPVYGPAFVGFLGGSHWGVGFGFGGGIGWFPLGWGEPYRPWYHASDRYFRNVNIRNTYIRNTTIINNRTNNFNYAYAHNARAVTVASRNNFVNGERINRGAFHVSDSDLRRGRVSNNAGFSPNQRSYFGGNGPGSHIARPSASIQNRQVVARTAPARAASNMPVRRFDGANNANNAGGRGGSNHRDFDNRGGFGNARGPVMGRAAETNAAANNNRPNFSQGNQGRFNRNNEPNSGVPTRQRELSQDKPQSHMRTAPSDSGTRNWSAQGNSTDRGRAPAGFGSNSPSFGNSRNTADRSDRPPSSFGSNNRGNNSDYSVRPRSSVSTDRPNYSNSNRSGARSYEPPQRSSAYSSDRPANNRNMNRSYSPPPSYNSNGNRGYSQPRSEGPSHRMYPSPSYSQPRSYSAPRGNSAPRSYSAPSRSYSSPAPSRGSSAPSHSGGGGGGNRGGGGSRSGGSPRHG